MTGRIGFALCLLLSLSGPPSLAQENAKPTFEVASVRRATPGSRQLIRVTSTRVDFVNVPLRTVILKAFRIELNQLSGPTWLNDVGVDIHATYSSGKVDDVPDMLKTLLVERFGLVTHLKPKSVDAYELVVAPGGPKMREVDGADERDTAFPTEKAKDETVVRTRTDEGSSGESRTRTALRSDGLSILHVTGRSRYESIVTLKTTTILDAARISMAELAKVLSTNLDIPVVDKTALSGLYQFKIELDRSAMTARIAKLDTPTGVSTFKAIEGLGLKLQERRSPVDILIVDHIERSPTAD